MNPQTAEMLLRCYRPGKTADGRTQKAIKVAEQDPELKQKLSDQIQFDEEIVEVIHGIKPPENLWQKLSELSAQPGTVKPGLGRQAINPAMLTAILGVFLLMGVVAFLIIERLEKFPGRERVEGLLGTAAKMTGVEFEPVTTTTSQLGDWLYMRGFEGFEAPPEVAALPVVGSRVFRYDGHSVAQAAIDSHESLLYEFHASEFGVQLPPDGDWLLLRRDEWVGAIRQRGDHCFLLALRGTKAQMREFLQSLPKK
jgi:hypothetical protein